jgi:hypothetical protein
VRAKRRAGVSPVPRARSASSKFIGGLPAAAWLSCYCLLPTASPSLHFSVSIFLPAETAAEA